MAINDIVLKKTKEAADLVTGGPYAVKPVVTGAANAVPTGGTAVGTLQTAAKPAGYTVGAGYTPDTSLYADKKDKNAITAQQYDKQLSAYQAALQAAYDNQAAANRLEAQKLKNEFDASRSNVYTNSRLSAIGNNERLAALGLAGNMYDYARSGTSETSRIGQDIAMRKSLAGLDQSENEARSDLAMQLLSAQREAEANYANKVAEVEAAKIPYLTALAKSTSSGGGGSSGGSYSGGSSSPSKKSGDTNDQSDSGSDTSGGSIASVHNAIVANRKNGFSAAQQAANIALATSGLTGAEYQKAAEEAGRLLERINREEKLNKAMAEAQKHRGN